MSKRSILSLVYAIHNLEDMGLNTSDLLLKYGFSLHQLDPFGQIERTTELKLLSELLPKVDDPTIGLELGKQFSLVGYGPFSLMLMTAPNAFEATRMGIRYQDLTYLYGRMKLNISTKQSSLDIFVTPLPPNVRNQLIDRDISGTFQLLTDIFKIVGESVKLQEVWIPHDDMGQAERYQSHFQCPIKFNAEHTRLIVNSVNLSHPFPQANPVAFELYQQQCNHLLHTRNQHLENISLQVQDYMELFERDFPTLHQVANLLASSERTLRRQLKEEQTSFRHILNNVRCKKAKHLLTETNMPIEHIAERLGYSEPASFNHAFTRWTAISPSQYRANC